MTCWRPTRTCDRAHRRLPARTLRGRRVPGATARRTRGPIVPRNCWTRPVAGRRSPSGSTAACRSSENAADVAGLVDRLVDAWPRPVDGGGVRRSLDGRPGRPCRGGARRADVVGGPGLPRRAARRPTRRRAARAAGQPRHPGDARLPEVAPFADHPRRAQRRDPRSARRDRRRRPAVAARRRTTASARPWGRGARLGRPVFGDLLVLLDSAEGRGAEVDADFRHLTGAHHFDLLNHPRSPRTCPGSRWRPRTALTASRSLWAGAGSRPSARAGDRCATGRRAGGRTGAARTSRSRWSRRSASNSCCACWISA